MTGDAANAPKSLSHHVRAGHPAHRHRHQKLEPVHLVAAKNTLQDVVRGLNDAAYSRVDLVAKRGEYAVRAASSTSSRPPQLPPCTPEFFSDELDEMRHFSVADQRTLSGEGLTDSPCCPAANCSSPWRVMGQRHA